MIDNGLSRIIIHCQTPSGDYNGLSPSHQFPDIVRVQRNRRRRLAASDDRRHTAQLPCPQPQLSVVPTMAIDTTIR